MFVCKPLSDARMLLLLLLIAGQAALGATGGHGFPALIPYSGEHGRWGYLNPDTLEVVIPPRFYRASPFRYGLGPVSLPFRSNSRHSYSQQFLYNWVRPNGKLVFQNWFSATYEWHQDGRTEPATSGIFTVILPDGRSGIISLKKGGWVVKPAVDQKVDIYSPHRFLINNRVLVIGDQRYKAPDGTLIERVSFDHHFFRIKDGDETGIADWRGHIIVPPDYMTVDYFPEIQRAIVGGFNNPLAKFAFFIAPRGAWDTLMGWMAAAAVVDEDGNEIRSFGSDVYLGRLRDDIGYYQYREDDPPRQRHYFSLITGKDLDATQVEASAGLHLFHEDGRTGLETVNGKVLIPATYDKLIPLNTKLFIAKKAHTRDDGYGLINRHNEVVAPFQYDHMKPAGHNRLGVGKDGLHGQINWQGDTIIDLIYDSAFYFGPNGLAIVSKNDNNGVINHDGKVIISIRYDDIVNTRLLDKSRKTYFQVEQDDKQGLLSTSGKVLIPPKYGVIRLTEGIQYGWVEVWDQARDLRGLINVRSGVTLPLIYEAFDFFDHLLVARRYDQKSITDSLYQLYTLAGKPTSDQAYPAMEHAYSYFVAAHDSGYGVLDSHGRVLIPFVYRHIVAVGPSLVRATKRNGRRVYINTNSRIYRPRGRSEQPTEG